MITDHSKTTRDYTVAGKWQVPINFHGACLLWISRCCQLVLTHVR